MLRAVVVHFQHPYKRMVAIAKAQGKLNGAVEAMNKYLDLYVV